MDFKYTKFKIICEIVFINKDDLVDHMCKIMGILYNLFHAGWWQILYFFVKNKKSNINI